MFVPQKDSSGTDRAARMERSLIRLHAAILILLGGLSLVAAGGLESASALAWASAGLWFVVAVDLLARGERPVQLALLLVAVAVGVWAQADLGAGALGLVVGVFGLSAARLLTAPAFVVAMAGAAATSIGVGAIVDPATIMVAVDDAVLSVAMAFAFRGLLQIVTGASEKMGEVDRELAEARRAEATTIAERDAAERAARALHDEVLTALRGIAEGWPEETVRRDAGTAAAAVLQASTPTPDQRDPQRSTSGLDGYIRSVTDACPVAVDLDLDLEGDPGRTDLPSSTTDALVRATRELLRNVGRHSGVHRATLRIEVRAEALEIRVIDRGSGDPDQVVAGFGLQSSVMEPLKREGIEARFEQTDGGGVTVVITVPRRVQAVPGRLATAYRETLKASLAESPASALVLPIGGAYSYIAVRNSWTWSSPLASLLLVVGYTVVLGVIVSRLRAGPPDAVWLVAVTAVLVGLTAVGLALAPSGSMLDFRGWPVGYAAVVVAVLLPVLPSWTGGLVLAPFAGLVLIAQRLEPGLSDGEVPWSALNAALMLPLGMLAVGVALRRVGRRVESDQQTVARLWLEDACRHAADWISNVHLAHTRTHVLPWLASVADGAIPVAESETLANARVLALEVRDDLYAPGFFDDELRRVVSQFRQHGGQVRVRPAAFVAQEGHPVRDVLRDLVGVLPEPRRITLSFASEPDAENGWRVVMVPPAPETAGRVAAIHNVESDADRTVIVPRGVVSA